MPGSRPEVAFTPELAERICESLASGVSLRATCEQDGMPPESTVRLWVVRDVQGFAAQYAHARSIGYDVMAEGILDLADRPLIGQKSVSKATGLEITEGDNVDRSRLQIDARKWLLSKMLPKKYGEKQQIEHSGAVSIGEALRAAREKRKADES
jgi:hypothetical protein